MPLPTSIFYAISTQYYAAAPHLRISISTGISISISVSIGTSISIRAPALSFSALSSLASRLARCTQPLGGLPSY
jgi:hypothetical protein